MYSVEREKKSQLFYFAGVDNVLTTCYDVRMRDEAKTKLLQIRVTEDEKEEMRSCAKAKGFDTISSFILWLFRKHGKKGKD